MTFTFDPALADDVSLVRFHVGDAIDTDHRLEDATIQYYLTNNDVGTAVIRCIQYIITRLSQPDETVGSYSINNANALAGYKELLKMKSQEFGISISGAVAYSSVSTPWRADSYMTNGTQDGTP